MRISATTLEAYRLYLDDQAEWMTFERLAEQLRGEQKTTPEMTRGTSLHEILETPQAERKQKFGCTHTSDKQYGSYGNSAGDMYYDEEEGEEVECYMHLGHLWQSASVDAIHSSGGINEIKVEYPIETAYGDAVLVAKADKVLGLQVIDYKTTSNAFKADKYLNSVQWKIYCLAFGALGFTYRVFEIREKEGQPKTIKAAHTLKCFPYHGMKEDVQSLTDDFVDFCHQHGFYRAIGKGFH